MRGYQFNRQKPLDKYIVDFYCRKLNLVIEVDGASHDHDAAHLSDVKREIVLREMGLHLLRFSEKEVRYQMQDVLERISQWIDEEKKESPNPLYKGMRCGKGTLITFRMFIGNRPTLSHTTISGRIRKSAILPSLLL